MPADDYYQQSAQQQYAFGPGKITGPGMPAGGQNVFFYAQQGMPGGQLLARAGMMLEGPGPIEDYVRTGMDAQLAAQYDAYRAARARRAGAGGLGLLVVGVVIGFLLAKFIAKRKEAGGGGAPGGALRGLLPF
jgi:hypothetical protein